MTKEAQELLQKAMAMSPEDRATMVHQLLGSLEPAVEADVDAAWQEEIARRLGDIEAGTAEFIPLEAVVERLRNRKRATG